MKILSKITGKTIDTEKYFNPSDYETADPKSVTVIFGPRNIGKTTAYLKDVIKIIESGGQFI
jgi:predicted AAA+ superfamily ATPase